jgi:hypothetical protein
MAWACRIDEGPNPGENEEPGARLGHFFIVPMKKMADGGLAGTMAGDALKAPIRSTGWLVGQKPGYST